MSDFPYPTLKVSLTALLALTKQMAGRVTYHLGAKAPLLSCDPTEISEIDCSGFVRYALFRSSGGAVKVPDGSVQMHDAIRAVGLKPSSVEAAKLQDGAIRIAFLSPTDGGGVGHVVLILDGATCESHGGVGVDRRPWTGEGWQGKTSVYVVTAPTR